MSTVRYHPIKGILHDKHWYDSGMIQSPISPSISHGNVHTPMHHRGVMFAPWNLFLKSIISLMSGSMQQLAIILQYSNEVVCSRVEESCYPIMWYAKKTDERNVEQESRLCRTRCGPYCEVISERVGMSWFICSGSTRLVMCRTLFVMLSADQWRIRALKSIRDGLLKPGLFMDGISRLCSVAYQIMYKLTPNIKRINAKESGTQSEILCLCLLHFTWQNRGWWCS